MYETFYGLNEKPFNVTPDPRFLYLGEHHQEALAHLIYGINDRKGFVVITGEVGTGKTTLIHTLLERLEPRVKTALVFNPNLTLEDFFLTVFDEFELTAEKPTKAYFLIALNNFLLERLKQNENAVLIVDEAQNLPLPILEEIRLLLNLETSKEKLLQIVLSGQQELNQKLALPELRQLKQRISIRYHIPPLSRKETKQYVQERLRIAGSQNASLFTDRAIDEIYTYAKGIPRLINILGDNSLLLGYAEEKSTIDHIVVRECIADLELRGVEPEIKPPRLPGTSARFFGARAWRLAFMLFFLVFVLAGYLFWNPEMVKDFFFRLPRVFTASSERITALIHRTLHSSSEGIANPSTTLTKIAGNQKHLRDVAIAPEALSTNPTPSVSEKPVPAQPSEGTTKEPGPSQPVAAVPGSPSEYEKVPETVNEAVKPTAPGQRVIVQRNDSLSKISVRHYGMVSDALITEIQKLNPQITDINYIEEGWQIFLPVVNESHPGNKLFSVHVGSFDRFADAHELFSRLATDGYEVSLIPVSIPRKGQWYRITVGKFNSQKEAAAYAAQLLTSRAFSYAQPVPIAQAEAMEIEK